ncbi:hypothetical protein GCM10010406_35030 [Streptomyces thermolineatus]|uniref:Uncharacterized protein n=1 Tax=Streptomyces thermolineatus TaxID=44033 RepID=A0ABN3M5H1_9ACTN
MIGIDHRTGFRPRLADQLLASRACYAGQGYCYALARFGTTADAEILTAYLDHYLRRPECRYDQHWAAAALLHLDALHGTDRAGRFLEPGGLWEQWGALDTDVPGWCHRRLTELIHQTTLPTPAT